MVRLALALTVVLAPTLAHAHAKLVDPPSRTDTDANKSGPCDNAHPPDAPRTTFAPGQTIEVEWLETVDHVGHFRLAFSPDGENGFDDHVLIAEIADGDDQTPRTVTATVTLPNVTCDNCALQLIQCMQDGGGPDCSNYYSCADIRLAGDAPPAVDAGPPGDEVDAGDNGGDGADDGTTPPGNTVDGDGCQAAPGGMPASIGAGVLFLIAFGYLLGRQVVVREKPRRRHR
jgi:hypothetical protein